MDRRTTLKWMLSAAGTLPALSLLGCDSEPASTATPTPPSKPSQKPAASAGAGYGTDPDLVKNYAPGELWPLTLTAAQRRTATALSGLILPADDEGPGAVEVGVVEFIDEWISAPYPQQRKDRTQVLAGFEWLDAEARRRFERGFADLEPAQQTAICDDICHLPKASAERREAAAFFARYRDLTAGGFCTSPEGRKYLRYVGNMPMQRFDGPPPEVLKQVGVG